MDSTLCVTRGGKSIQVAVVRKKIKNVHLRVYPDGRTVLSAPMKTDMEWIKSFVEAKAEWLFSVHNRYGERMGPKDGFFCVLGTERKLVTQRGRNGIFLLKDEIIVRMPNPCEKTATRKVEKFLNEQALSYMRDRVKELFPFVADRVSSMPSVSVRKMKSAWGTCNTASGKIKFNSSLFAADPECIDYVVLHELTHLFIPGHQKNFYAFIQKYMPDWKQRRTRLNRKYSGYL